MPAARPQVYALHGLRLASPVPVAGFAATGDAATGEADVDVRWETGPRVPTDAPAGRLGAAAPNAAGDGYLYVAAVDARGRWTVRVPGTCDFLIDPVGATLVCRLDPSSDRAFVAILVAGLAMAFLLALRGHCALHASAVEVSGSAIAFAGPSGAGKSTLAALLCAAGARFVTDDVLRLGLGPRITCIGGSPHLRLRPTAAWALDHFGSPPATTHTVDRRLALTPAVRTGMEAVPLAAVVLPCLSRHATALELRRVTGAAAVPKLAGVCRVAGWTDPQVARHQLRVLARTAAGVPVVEAVIPWGGPALRAPMVPSLLDLAGRI